MSGHNHNMKTFWMTIFKGNKPLLSSRMQVFVLEACVCDTLCNIPHVQFSSTHFDQSPGWRWESTSQHFVHSHQFRAQKKINSHVMWGRVMCRYEGGLGPRLWLCWLNLYISAQKFLPPCRQTNKLGLEVLLFILDGLSLFKWRLQRGDTHNKYWSQCVLVFLPNWDLWAQSEVPQNNCLRN